MDYIVHRIFQARILEWVAFPFSRGSSQPEDQTQVSHVAGKFFTSWAAREAQEHWSLSSLANLCIIGIPEREEREKGIENVFGMLKTSQT